MPRPLLSTLVLLLLLGSAGRALATDFTVTLSVAVSGGTVTYTATACGSAKKEGPVSVGLYYNPGSAPSCATTADHTWSVPQLGGGVCEVLTHVRSNVAVGSYTAWALVDRSCAISESNESNNTASWAYKVQPELSISSLTAAVSGTSVTYTIIVKNAGVSTGGPFSVGLYFNRTTAPTCSTVPDQTLDVSAGLDLNQTTTLTHTRTTVPVGSYLAWAFADQGCAISEASETNNAISKAYDLGPNIYVLTPVVTVTATTVLYSVSVCANYSSENLGAFSVGLWYHRATAPTCGAGGQDHTWNVTSLTKGSCTTLTHTRTAAPPGSYTAQVFADPGCTLAESRESDNLRNRVYTVGAPTTPDLTISSFTATVTDLTVSYKVTVCNQGATAGAFSVGLYDPTAAPTCTSTASHTWTVASLGSTLCQTLTHTRSGVSVGAYTAWVLADSSCAIAESSETNNATSADYGVGLPEVAISSFSAAVAGNQVSYTAQVCGTGTAITVPFTVGIYFDRPTGPACADAPDASQTVSSLAAGACAQVVAVQAAAGIGTHKAWAFADNLCQVTEGNEANNLRSYDFGVGVDQPDLRISNFTVTSIGGTASFVITVCNAGVAAAAGLELGVVYDRSTAPQCGDPVDWTASLASLAPGDCETRTHTRSNAAAGSYKAWAFVDSGCQVGESDESNNTAGHSYSVTLGKIDLAVIALTATPSGSGALFLATLCNVGGDRSPATTTALYHDRAAAPAAGCADLPDLKVRLDPLDPGQCVNQGLLRKAGPPGSYKAWVVVDGECALAEDDELNNGASVAYTLTPNLPGDGGLDGGGESGGGDGCACQVGARGSGLGLVGFGILGLALWRRRSRRIPCRERSRRSTIDRN